MKANELMIGDWVRIEGKPFQVTQINNKSVPSEVGTYPYEEEDIYPIPLTPEILEKNGFYRREIPTRDEIGHYYHRTTDPCSIFVRMSFGDGRDFGNEIQYVHELQHLLKLCGIDKEIVI